MKPENTKMKTDAMIRLPKKKLQLGAAAESAEPLVWDPRFVQSLITQVGEMAEVLILGRREAEALEKHLQTSFPGEEVSLHDYRYAGLQVVVVGEESCIRVETPKSIHESSRHALLRKHEERPHGEARKSLETSEFRFQVER